MMEKSEIRRNLSAKQLLLISSLAYFLSNGVESLGYVVLASGLNIIGLLALIIGGANWKR